MDILHGDIFTAINMRLESAYKLMLSFTSKHFHKMFKTPLVPEIVAVYFSNGDLEILKTLKLSGCSFNSNIYLDRALSGGHLDTIKWLIKTNNFTFTYLDSKYIAIPAKYGHLNALKWLKRSGRLKSSEWTVSIIINAATLGGHLKILQWLMRSIKRVQFSDLDINWWNYISALAATAGHIHILEWTLKNTACLSPCVCNNAAESGHLELLKWAIGNHYPFVKAECINRAARGNETTVLNWLLNYC